MRQPESSRPNVVILVSHDTGRHVSPSGIETVRTPNLESFSSGGVSFDHAFCTTPQCSPARAALFSGMYPHSVGVMGNVGRDKGWRFPDDRVHAARIFANAGYETCLVGMQHETYLLETLGFARLEPAGERNSIVDVAPAMRSFLAQRDRTRPYYCQIGCIETHRPWERTPEPPDSSLGITVPPYLFDGPGTRDDLSHFQAQVARFDRGVGEILDLIASDDEENTIVVITSDHGIPFPRAKGTLFDAGIGVFLFLRYPAAGMSDGRRVADLVSHVDVLPSILELCSISVPPHIEGRSFTPMLRHESIELHRDAVFAEKTWFHFYDPMRCIRTRDFKFVQNFEFSRQTETPLDSVHAASFAELHQRYAGGHPPQELYDLSADPFELDNVAEREEFAAVRDGLVKRLAAWMRETDDPILKGPIASPVYYRAIEAVKE